MAGIDERRLSEIRDRASAASPGPWILGEAVDDRFIINTARSDGRRLRIMRDLQPAGEGDVQFIAMARELIPRLLDVIETQAFDEVTTEDLDLFDEVVANASAGPWTAFIEDEQPIGGCSVIWAGDDPDGRDLYVWLDDEIAPAADFRFVAAARTDIPELLYEVRTSIADN